MPETSQSRRTGEMGLLIGVCILALMIAHVIWLDRGSAEQTPDHDPAMRPAAIFVRHQGLVDLAPFRCRDIARDGFIRRVCYDEGRAEMIVSLNGTHYAHCGIPARVVEDLMAADSMRRYYGAQVRGRYDCRAS
jgi:KTSC domain